MAWGDRLAGDLPRGGEGVAELGLDSGGSLWFEKNLRVIS